MSPLVVRVHQQVGPGHPAVLEIFFYCFAIHSTVEVLLFANLIHRRTAFVAVNVLACTK